MAGFKIQKKSLPGHQDSFHGEGEEGGTLLLQPGGYVS
jgi:hypothetical protein